MSTRSLETTLKKGDGAGKQLVATFNQWPNDLTEAIGWLGEDVAYGLLCDALEDDLKLAMRKQPDNPQAALDGWVPGAVRKSMRATTREAKRAAKAKAKADKLMDKLTPEEREAILAAAAKRRGPEEYPPLPREHGHGGLLDNLFNRK